MIIRPLTLTINNDKATLNEKVTLYQGDGGICLEIQLKSVKFGFNGQEMLHNESIEYANRCIAWVERPDGYLFQIPNVLIQDNKVHIYVEKTWTDEEVTEIGTHTVQLILYSEDNSRVTLPPFTFSVLEPIYDYNIEADFLTEDYVPVLIEDGTGIRISQLPLTNRPQGYVPLVQDNTTKKTYMDLDKFASVEYVDREITKANNRTYSSGEIDRLLDKKSDTSHTHTSVNGYEVVVLTEDEYMAIVRKSPSTLYFIVEE